MRRHTSRLTQAAAVAAATILTGLIGCTGTDSAPDEATADSQQAPVIVPGRPGEPARTASPGETVPVPQPTEADFDFVQGMIPHHQQALEMVALVDGRATNQQVQGLAGRIRAAQQPEIDVMESWLDRQGVPVSTEGHGHNGSDLMPGMATPEQMTQLAGSRDAAFDRLFLQLMIAHHEGAVTMATDVLADGLDLTVQHLAQEVLATQTAEIDRMQTILGG